MKSWAEFAILAGHDVLGKVIVIAAQKREVNSKKVPSNLEILTEFVQQMNWRYHKFLRIVINLELTYITWKRELGGISHIITVI